MSGPLTTVQTETTFSKFGLNFSIDSPNNAAIIHFSDEGMGKFAKKTCNFLGKLGMRKTTVITVDYSDVPGMPKGQIQETIRSLRNYLQRVLVNELMQSQSFVSRYENMDLKQHATDVVDQAIKAKGNNSIQVAELIKTVRARAFEVKQ